jgi:hypothetical protein
MRVLDVWYESLDATDLLPTIRDEDTPYGQIIGKS